MGGSRRLGTENINNSMVSQNSAIDTASPNETPGPLVNGSTFAEESMQAAVGWGHCCNHCGGDRQYCSPESGNCYKAKEKDYYHHCFSSGAGAGWGHCCNHCCGDRQYCSPESGNCYIAKEKPYYHHCSSSGAGAGWGHCCNHCGGDRQYCSPESGNCYIAKEKDYYHDCWGSRRLGTKNITSMSPQ